MKMILKYIPLLLVLVVFACEDTDTQRIPDVEQVVNLRAQTTTTAFDATDPSAGLTLTYFSQNTNFQRVEVIVSHFSLLTSTTTDQAVLDVLEGNVGNDGTTTRTFTLAQMVAPLGLSPTDLAGGDAVNLFHRVTLQDGRIFPDTILAGTDFETVNVTPNITASSRTTSFAAQMIFPIVCQLPEGFATGSYLFEQITPLNPTYFGFAQLWGGEVVEITATSNTGRTFTAEDYLGAFGGFDSPFAFDLACNVVLLANQSFPVGCGSSIQIDQNVADIGTFDINDDSQFTIGILHDVNESCGQGISPVTFRLTKQ